MNCLDVLGLASGLCQQANGAGDPWPPDEVARARAYLRERLDGWRPGLPGQGRRDAAAFTYVSEALKEHEALESGAR